MPDVELDELAGPDGGRESQRLAKFWRDKIEKMDKDKRFMQFLKRGRKIEARYRDERHKSDEDERRRYNALWSNVEILKPAIYGRIPVPMVERRFGDKDPIARGAAQILERALRNEIEICGFNEAVSQAVSDYLLPGRGAVWVRYEPEIGTGVSLTGEDSIDMKDNQGSLNADRPDENDDEDEGEGEPEQQGDPSVDKLQATNNQIIRESTPVDFINWQDLLIFPENARTWAEVVAIGKRVYMTFTQMSNRFGKDIAKKVPLQKDERLKYSYENTSIEHEVKGEVFEIWNKEDKTVYWVAEGYEYLLDRKDDPLNLEYFWPIPRPIIANQTTGTLIPVGDYIQYQDQATQIDELSQRIAMLTRACKVAGVYDSASRGVRRLLDESVENELIPVDNWAAFAEKGGLAGQISFLPLKEIMGVLNELVQMKQSQIEEMDRLTGINDLMRGTNDARETLGGVRIKTNYTGTRLTNRQNEIARFARDTVRIMADIMCQHFSPQSLVEASGAMFEEGLGVNADEVEMQMAASQPPGANPQSPYPGTGPIQPGGAPTPTPGQAGPGLPPPGGPPPQQGMPPQPMGSNVVPFRPQVGNMPVSAGNVPQTPPQAPPVAPGMPGPPPINPLQMALQQALERINKAIGLLRNERLRGFRVDIEVDSTIYGDAVQEKQDRNEFIGNVTKFLQTAMAMSAQVPEITPLMGKLLQFAVRGYRVGRDLESSIEDFTDQAVKIAKQAQEQKQSQPNPEQIKAQAQADQAKATAQSAQMRAKADMAKSQGDIQTAQINAQADREKAGAEVQRQQVENQGEQTNQQIDLIMKQMEMRMRQMELQMEEMRTHSEIAGKAFDAVHPPKPPNPAEMQGGVGSAPPQQASPFRGNRNA